MYEGGNTTEKVVDKGEKEVVKDEVLPTSNLQDCAAHYFLLPNFTILLHILC